MGGFGVEGPEALEFNVATGYDIAAAKSAVLAKAVVKANIFADGGHWEPFPPREAPELSIRGGEELKGMRAEARDEGVEEEPDPISRVPRKIWGSDGSAPEPRLRCETSSTPIASRYDHPTSTLLRKWPPIQIHDETGSGRWPTRCPRPPGQRLGCPADQEIDDHH